MTVEPSWKLTTANNMVVNNNTGAAIKIHGQQLENIDLWRLTRALDGTEISISVGDPAEQVVKYVVIGSNLNNGPYSSASCHLIKNTGGDDETEIELHNHGYYLKHEIIGQGNAWGALALQVETAYRLGFKRIVALTEGRNRVHMSGALTTGKALLTNAVGALQWPKMGFDGPLPESFFSSAPQHKVRQLGIHPGDRVSTLRQSSKGKDLWEEFHSDMTMTLELNPLSDGAKDLLKWAAKNR